MVKSTTTRFRENTFLGENIMCAQKYVFGRKYNVRAKIRFWEKNIMCVPVRPPVRPMLSACIHYIWDALTHWDALLYMYMSLP